MKTRYKILVAIISISSIGILLFEISDNFSNGLIHDMKKNDAIKKYQMLDTTCNDVHGEPDGVCFTNAFDKCESATIKHMSSTFEGDPIFYYAIIIPDESCQIHFEMDVSQDKWKGITAKGLIQKICTNIQLEEHKIQFQCNGDEHVFYLR